MNHTTEGKSGIAIIGGAVFDRKYHSRAALVFGTSNPVDGWHSHGGVGRNVAENLARLGVVTRFISIVGHDETGAALLRHLAGLGVDIDGVAQTAERPTAEYAAILDPANELVLGIADMAIFDLFSVADLERAWPVLETAAWVFADCNIPAAVLDELIERCEAAGILIAANTVSTPKAVRLKGKLARLDLLFTNRDEADAILGQQATRDERRIEVIAQELCAAGAKAVIVTDGAAGYALAENGDAEYVPVMPARPIDITGAGDAMIAGTLCQLLAGADLRSSAQAGALLAARTTETTASVLPDLSPEFFSGTFEQASA